MTQTDLKVWCKLYKRGEIELKTLLDAVDAYSSASNNGNAIVSGALPLVEQSLLDEAVSDVITISTLNEYSVAKKLISEQFIVIDKQDLSGNNA